MPWCAMRGDGRNATFCASGEPRLTGEGVVSGTPPMRRNTPIRSRVAGRVLVVVAGCLGVAGCETPIGVKETGFEEVYRGQRNNVLDTGELSARTVQVLSYVGLRERYEEDRSAVIAELSEFAAHERARPLQAAVAEMCYEAALVEGDRADFLAAVIHAYLYLLSDDLLDEADPYSPLFRLCCDIYNRGLAQYLLREEGDVLLTAAALAEAFDGLEVEHTRPGFPWSEAEFSRFLPADAFEVRGLRERIRSPGLGVPLIALQSPEGAAEMAAAHVGHEVKLSATAFLRLHGGVDELEAGTMRGSLELYLGTEGPRTMAGGQSVPLESDFSAPLAHMLETSNLWDWSMAGFLPGDLGNPSGDYESGIFLLEPYRRGKVPLVLIHGTASSPAYWVQTINSLMADPEIRERYQVWLSLYETSNPISHTAAIQRKALRDLVATVDPGGDDPALSQMVLVGHSQGGLVTRMLISSCGDDVWDAFYDVSLDEMQISEELRDIARKAVYFDALSFVNRAVFISTPHGGSFFSDSLIGHLAAELIDLPLAIADETKKVLGKDDEVLRPTSSVENMKVDSRFVRALSLIKMSPDVRLHSIIPVNPSEGPIEEGNDGVVDYTSAHIGGVESELVIRFGHSVQSEPATVAELRRILYEHLDARVGEELPPVDEGP
jgi:pimeloyl-ACP methyl ester carboxylesterase